MKYFIKNNRWFIIGYTIILYILAWSTMGIIYAVTHPQSDEQIIRNDFYNTCRFVNGVADTSDINNMKCTKL